MTTAIPLLHATVREEGRIVVQSVNLHARDVVEVRVMPLPDLARYVLGGKLMRQIMRHFLCRGSR